MRIIIVGLGSMGKRRIRNLLKLGFTDIIGFDPRSDRRKEAFQKYKIKTVSSIEDGLVHMPKVMIISTPPDLHYKYANIAIKKNINFFTEVNLSSADIKKIIRKLKHKSIVAFPSCTTLYNPVVMKLRELIKKKSIGRILTMYHHFGHYLPNWHPWESYKEFYVSKRKTGAAREVVPFELVWITSLFSEIDSVYGQVTKISKLDADIDDIYEIFMKFKNGIHGTLIIDVLSKAAFSETKIIGEKGVIVCDHNTGEIKLSHGKKWKVIKLEMGKIAKGYKGNTGSELLYEQEMSAFLDAVMKNKRYPHSFSDELKLLRVLDKIEISNKNGKKIQV